MEPKYPQVILNMDEVGVDGNAFFILGAVRRACKNQLTKESFESIYKEFLEDAKSRDYDHLLQCLGKYFSISFGDELEDEFWDDENQWDVVEDEQESEHDDVDEVREEELRGFGDE